MHICSRLMYCSLEFLPAQTHTGYTLNQLSRKINQCATGLKSKIAMTMEGETETQQMIHILRLSLSRFNLKVTLRCLHVQVIGVMAFHVVHLAVESIL